MLGDLCRAFIFGHDIIRTVMGRSGKWVTIGVIGGIISALGVTRFLSHLMHSVSPFDPLTFVVISALLVVVALAASLLPARRAGKIDPIIALRHE